MMKKKKTGFWHTFFWVSIIMTDYINVPSNFKLTVNLKENFRRDIMTQYG